MTGPARGVTFDTGALIALERDAASLVAVLQRIVERDLPVAVPAGVLAQAWRGGRGKQVPLARFLNNDRVTIVALDETTARAAGVLCGIADHDDVVDASVVICARERGHVIVTSDRHDITKLDRTATIIDV